MKNLILTVLVSLFLTTPMYSQSSFDIKAGQTEKFKKRPLVVDLFKIEDNYFLVRKVAITGPGGWDYFIEKYSSSMKFEKSVKIIGKEGKRDRFVEGVFQLGENIAFVYSTNPPKVKKTEFKVEFINPVSLESIGKKLLFSIPKEYAKYSHTVEYDVSKTGKYFTTTYIQNAGETTGVLAIFHFSDEGDYVSNLLNAIIKNSSGSKLNQTLVADDGNVYLVLHKDQPDGTEGVSYFIYSINGEDAEKYDFETNPLAVSGLKIAEGENNNIIGAGEFNSTKNNETANDYFQLTKGVFTFRLNTENKTIKYGEAHPFSYEMAFDGWSKDDRKSVEGIYKLLDKKNLPNILDQGEDYDDFSSFDVEDVREMKDHIGFDDFILRDVMEHNGQILILAYTHSYSYYKSIIAVNFDKSGAFMYEKKFGIMQYGTNRRPFYLFNHDGTPTVIFPDNVKNTKSAELTKSPYLENDNTAYNAIVFSGDDPQRIVAFRRDLKPKLKVVGNITLTSDSKELIYISEEAGSGFRLTRIK